MLALCEPELALCVWWRVPAARIVRPKILEGHLKQKAYFCTRMKKIIESRKLLGVDKDVELKDLKTIYRNFMKDWHPDKFQDNPDGKLEAEEKSKAFIEAYHLLVSVAPETHALQQEKYTEVITSSRIIDFQYKSQTLQLNFADGSSYEYFGLPKNVYGKLLNSSTPDRFARRHIYHSYVYRKVSKAVE
jgi:curved DNA-binding protein CbpA